MVLPQSQTTENAGGFPQRKFWGFPPHFPLNFDLVCEHASSGRMSHARRIWFNNEIAQCSFFLDWRVIIHARRAGVFAYQASFFAGWIPRENVVGNPPTFSLSWSRTINHSAWGYRRVRHCYTSNGSYMRFCKNSSHLTKHVSSKLLLLLILCGY